MTDQLIQLFSNIPHEVTVFLLAIVPLTELRAALPIAVLAFGLSPVVAYTATVLGNLIPMFFVYAVLPWMMKRLFSLSPKVNELVEAYFDRLTQKHGERYSKWGAFFLFLFVAIPLPGTGVWTGTVLAVLFRIKPRLAVMYITLGLLVAGLIVLGITLGTFHTIQLIPSI